jgi:hypothetical protein
VYGRKSDAGPPFAVGVTHFDQAADDVAAFLFHPDNMGRWNDELCEKGQVRRAAAHPFTSLDWTYSTSARSGLGGTRMH